MFEDVTPNNHRLREYRPYILGEETNWITSPYNPFQSVNFGLYGKWQVYDDLAAKPYQYTMTQFLKKVDRGNCELQGNPKSVCNTLSKPRSVGTPILDMQVPFFQVYGSDTGNRVNNGAIGITRQPNNLYRRLYTT